MKKILMFLGLVAGGFHAGAQNLIVNGAFDIDTPTSWNCGLTPTGWSTDNMGVQIEDRWNNENWWIDLTNCDWGNFYGLRYIAQTVTTQVGQKYRLTFDLGCWNYESYTTGGVDVYVNDTLKGHFDNDDFSGNPLTWETFTVCFTAFSTQTSIKFVCASRATANTPYWVDLDDFYSGVIVVGLDNVVLKAATQGSELIVNGGFAAGSTGCPRTPPGWKAVGAPYYGIEVTTTSNGNNKWVDMTSCQWGNGRWIEQKVPTGIGNSYKLKFKVGTGSWYNAAVKLYINSNYIGKYEVIHDSLIPLKWKEFSYDFVATTDSTVIRFLAAATDSVPVIGLDTVSLREQVACPNGQMVSNSPGKMQPASKNAVANKDVLLSPNPVESGASQVQLNLIAPAGQIEVIIADYMGRQYVNQRFDIRNGGAQTLSVELGKSGLAPGTYLLKIDGLGQPASQVLIVK